jgi:hypothetical protein
MDLSDDKWKERIYTMLAFCVAADIGIVAAVVARLI